MRALLTATSLSLFVLSAGCGGGTATSPVPADPSSAGRTTQANGAPGGGGGGGGTTTLTIPPAMTIDGPSQVLYFASSATGAPPSADGNFDKLQNQTVGPTIQGRSRVAVENLYNNSKKTALTVTSATIGGANASDFTVSAIPTAPLPPNKDAVAQFVVTFTPTGEGVRTATLSITSNAGTAVSNLSGTGYANRPIETQYAPLAFFPTGAPVNLTMGNSGGQVLDISSVSFTGAHPEAFVLSSLFGSPIGNCLFISGAPVSLGPGSFCNFAVGLAPGATAPASAFLTIISNDPLTPVQNVPLTLNPL